MANIVRYLPILQILFSICSVHCRNSNFNTIKRMYTFQRNLNISNVINDVLMYNSSENFECLNELKTLVNDFSDLDESAIQSRYISRFHILPPNQIVFVSFSFCIEHYDKCQAL